MNPKARKEQLIKECIASLTDSLDLHDGYLVSDPANKIRIEIITMNAERILKDYEDFDMDPKLHDELFLIMHVIYGRAKYLLESFEQNRQPVQKVVQLDDFR